jgi:ABC-type transport system substrate-binding protein
MRTFQFPAFCRTALKTNVAVLSLTISLILLSSFPTMNVARVQAVNQNGNTTWSPFGPREQKLTITIYSDFASMFTAFVNGQIDITDWPLQPANLGSGSATAYCDNSFNPDFFCTNKTGEFGIFDLQINHYPSFLGIPMSTTRSPPSPTIVLPVTTGSSSCGPGSGQLTIHLLNQEQGNSSILDSLNKLTIASQPSGQPSATVMDSGGANPIGTYIFPCILAGSYKISSSLYSANSSCSTTSPTSCVFIGSGQSVSATLLVDWNSQSTRQLTQAGIYIGRALAHLLDKPSFVNAFFKGAATYDDEMLAPAQGVPNLFSITAECADHPWFNPCNPVSGYNFVSDSIAGGSEWWTTAIGNSVPPSGYSGVSDIRAACDSFVKAGFTVVGGANSTDCGDVALASIGTIVPSSYAHLSNNGQQVKLDFRSNNGRKQLGVIIGDSLNFLFGTPNYGQAFPGQTPPCTVLYNTLGCTLHFPLSQFLCEFGDGAFPGCWQLYMGGFSLDPTPDNLYGLFYSSFASNICGGTYTSEPNDYPFYCDPQFDTFAGAGEFASSLSLADQFFARAAAIGASNVMDVPLFSGVDTFVELNGWNFQQCTGSPCASSESSIVNTLGSGTEQAYWTLLNARQVPGYNPCAVPDAPSSCAQYVPGGGDPTLIRRGFSQDTDNFNPFQASSLWDFEVVSQIFDSMLRANPLTGGVDGQIVDWQITSYASSFNPSEVSCNAYLGCAMGTTTQLWHLRNDLKFQDGNPVTANDVAYSIL